MNRRNEPLSPEERDLAERLARLGGPREPAPALDAAILASARAAVTPAADPATPAAAAPADPKITPLRPRPSKPRWPLGFGLAASLVLAAGIGWKLQGDGEGRSAESSQAAPMAAHDEAIEAVMIDPPAAPPPPPPLEQAADAAATATMARPETRSPSEPLREAPGGFVADAAPMAAPAAPAAAASDGFASSEPAPAAEAKMSDDKEELDSVVVSGSRVAPKRSVGAAEYTRTPLSQRREQSTAEREAAGAAKPALPAPAVVAPPAPPAPLPPPPAPADRARSGNAAERDATAGGFDERPPVSADSPEFRQAWLQRIRERLARGEEQAARESLQEFRRRYPDVELPEDLRKLAATLPPPAP
jgi:hypothetical protein